MTVRITMEAYRIMELFVMNVGRPCIFSTNTNASSVIPCGLGFSIFLCLFLFIFVCRNTLLCSFHPLPFFKRRGGGRVEAGILNLGLPTTYSLDANDEEAKRPEKHAM